MQELVLTVTFLSNFTVLVFGGSLLWVSTLLVDVHMKMEGKTPGIKKANFTQEIIKLLCMKDS